MLLSLTLELISTKLDWLFRADFHSHLSAAIHPTTICHNAHFRLGKLNVAQHADDDVLPAFRRPCL
jgi:hypothetical protein